MREIKFRGLHDGIWIYGYLSADDQITAWTNKNGTGTMRYIDPKTVGQYTGLKDKNGQGSEIYEGDELRQIKDDIIGDVRFERGSWVVYVDGELDHDLHYWVYCCKSCEIIGNIYEGGEK